MNESYVQKRARRHGSGSKEELDLDMDSSLYQQLSFAKVRAAQRHRHEKASDLMRRTRRRATSRRESLEMLIEIPVYIATEDLLQAIRWLYAVEDGIENSVMVGDDNLVSPDGRTAEAPSSSMDLIATDESIRAAELFLAAGDNFTEEPDSITVDQIVGKSDNKIRKGVEMETEVPQILEAPVSLKDTDNSGYSAGSKEMSIADSNPTDDEIRTLRLPAEDSNVSQEEQFTTTGYWEAVELLLESGESLNAGDGKDETALDILRRFGERSRIEYFSLMRTTPTPRNRSKKRPRKGLHPKGRQKKDEQPAKSPAVIKKMLVLVRFVGYLLLFLFMLLFLSIIFVGLAFSLWDAMNYKNIEIYLLEVQAKTNLQDSTITVKRRKTKTSTAKTTSTMRRRRTSTPREL